jgi:hypothetical protein
VAVWYILWLFGVFLTFWYVEPRKIWQPWFFINAFVRQHGIFFPVGFEK